MDALWDCPCPTAGIFLMGIQKFLPQSRFFTRQRKVSATSLFFESLPYKVDPSTGLVDYDALEQNALLFLPKVIVAGTSCYPRHLDYARFRKIADMVQSFFFA